jgi:XTP/dITP diphosphohydrolase
MPRSLIFATGNPHKVDEIRSVLPPSFEIQSLADLNFFDDIPETKNTLEGNALQKAQFVFGLWGKDCFAEDTGLEIEALRGEPGVMTARYAGPEKDANKNLDRVLELLSGRTNRRAQFRACIALILKERSFLFEGIIKGQISEIKRGKGGFGYDPIFIPEGHDRTFAEMDSEEKKTLSHRSRAFSKMINHLKMVE